MIIGVRTATPSPINVFFMEGLTLFKSALVSSLAEPASKEGSKNLFAKKEAFWTKPESIIPPKYFSVTPLVITPKVFLGFSKLSTDSISLISVLSSSF